MSRFELDNDLFPLIPSPNICLDICKQELDTLHQSNSYFINIMGILAWVPISNTYMDMDYACVCLILSIENRHSGLCLNKSLKLVTVHRE